MRRLTQALSLTALLIGVAGCGGSDSGGSTAAGSGGKAPAAPALSEADRQKVLASLPAPYNTADLANGRAKFALCSSCHTLTPGGPHMTGPNLHGVIGEQAGVRAGYNFSQPLKAAGFAWDAARLDAWIADPRAVIPGTKMTFAGVRNPKDRTDIIAYMMVDGSPHQP